MSLVRDPLAAAGRVTTELQAARLHQSLEAELALNDDLPAGWESEADAALTHLNDRFGGAEHLRDIDAAGSGKREWSPGLSSDAKRSMSTTDAPSPKTSPTGSGDAGGGKRASSPTPARSSARAKPRGRGRQNTRSGGRARGRGASLSLPGVSGSSGQLIASALAGSLVLVAVYVLLSSTTRGRNVPGLLAGGFVGSLRAFMAPIDPLAPKGGAAAPAPASSSAPSSPAPARSPVRSPVPNQVRDPRTGPLRG